MESQLGLLNSEAKGVLHVSAPVSFSTLHLAGALSAFQQAHPRVSINLQLNDRKVDVVDEGFDVTIRALHPRLLTAFQEVEADLHHAKYTPYLFALGFQHVIQFAAAQYYSLLIAMKCSVR